MPPSSLVDELVYIDAHEQPSSAASASAQEASEDSTAAETAVADDDATSTDLDESVTIGPVNVDANSPLEDLDQLSTASSISITTEGHERATYIPLRSDFVRMLAGLATHRHEGGAEAEVSAEELLNHAIRDLVQKWVCSALSNLPLRTRAFKLPLRDSD